MSKLIAGMVAGVFVGAFAMEMLNRKAPGLVRSLEDRTKHTVRGFTGAFAEGYRGPESQ